VIPGATPLQAAVASLKFFVELAALAAVAVWGARTGSGAVSVLLAVAAPLLVAAVWGRWNAPRSAHRLDPGPRTALELAVFLAAAGALVATGLATLGIVLAVVAIAVEALLYHWKL
jgi:hypothetical protein